MPEPRPEPPPDKAKYPTYADYKAAYDRWQRRRDRELAKRFTVRRS